MAGLRSYFAKHAWGNTQLSDLMRELELASGRDLAGWTEGWLDTAGTDRLSLETSSGGGAVLRATGPSGHPAAPASSRRRRLRPGRRTAHRWYAATWSRSRRQDDTTDVPDVADAALLLVNDEDLTFASVRPDASSLRTMLDSAAQLPVAVSRAVAVTTAWDMLVWGDLAATDFVRCVTAVLADEPATAWSSPTCRWRSRPPTCGLPTRFATACSSRSPDVCLGLSTNPARRQVAVRALAQTAVTDGADRRAAQACR